MLKLYENIKALRKEKDWSQDELARMVGYTDRSAIAKIESGAVDLSESKIMAFAKVFGVKPCILMGWENMPTPAADASISGEALMIAKAYDDADEVDKEMVRRILKLDKKESQEYAG